jgi:hypothetical protein
MKLIAFAAAAILLSTRSVRAEDAPASPPPADERQMQKWWDDLEGHEPVCSRALLKLADHPAQCVAFFKERLKPLTISEEEVKALIADLESDEENVWKPAFEKLQYFDPRLAIDLSTLMADNTKPISRNRLVEILSGRPGELFKGQWVQLRGTGADGYNFVAANTSWWAEHRVDRLWAHGGGNPKPKWTRACRAIVLLEHIASPEAVTILREMSTGHPDAEPTKTALEALEKMKPGDK